MLSRMITTKYISSKVLRCISIRVGLLFIAILLHAIPYLEFQLLGLSLLVSSLISLGLIFVDILRLSISIFLVVISQGVTVYSVITWHRFHGIESLTIEYQATALLIALCLILSLEFFSNTKRGVDNDGA